MNSTWETRDLPVLQAIVTLTDEGTDDIESAQIAEQTGVDENTVQRALWALAGEQPPFFTIIDATTFEGKHIAGIHDVTGHARRTVGTWPTPENLAERLVSALNDAAERETNTERKGKLRRAAESVGGVGKDVLTEVLASVITRSAGI